MQKKKYLFIVTLVLVAFLGLNGVIAHLTPADVVGAEEMGTPVLPIMVDNPYMIADIAELASPATVFVSVEWPKPEQPEQRRNVGQDPFSFFFDYWFNDPFSPQMPNQQTSAGTGFIIEEEGIILTNQHVVGNHGEGQTIKVILDVPGLKREYEAELIGSDVTLDLAVLKIKDSEGTKFPTVPLGDSDAARIGEWTIAIGNPYGQDFEHTVTVGVLSAKGREITIMSRETNTTKVYKNLMQTDAAINRGNSGGPLLNIKGEVIGINTAVHSQAQGIGFAIPINVAKEVLDDLITTGGVVRPWLGIHYQNITKSIAERLQLPDEKGVIIQDVVQGSPAQKAGLQGWDIIRRFGERDIFDVEDVIDEISKYKAGDEVLLTVYRQGKILLLPVTLLNMPANMR